MGMVILGSFFFISPSTPAEGVSDTTPPVMHFISFASPAVNYPGNIDIIANFTDDLSGVNYGFAQIVDSGNTMRCYDYLYLNTTTGYYEGQCALNQYWPGGLYSISEIVVFDNAGNYQIYYNGTDFTSPFVLVTGTTPDSLPPVFHSIAFTSNFVNYPGYIDVIANFTDDISGVNYAFAQIADSGNNLRCYDYLYLNTTTGYYEEQCSINQYWPGGIYSINQIAGYDNAGNYQLFYNGTDFISPTIQVTGTTPDSQPPILHSVSFVSNYINYPGAFDVVANITDDISGVNYAFVTILDSSSNTLRCYDYLYFNASNGLYEGLCFVDQY